MGPSRLLNRLVALAMLASLSIGTPSLLGQEKQIPFPLTFNEVSKGEVLAIPNGEDVLVRLSDLEAAGLTSGIWRRVLAFGRLRTGARRELNGEEFISLRSLAPYLSFKFDEASLALAITASPELLAATRLDVESGPPRDIVYAKDKSTFLNYSLTSTPHQRLTAFGELGSSIGGNLLLNTFSRAASGDFVRLLSNYTIDQRESLRRWTIGDANASTDLLGGSVLMGGVTVARNFNLDPYFVRYPPLNFRGTALTPSRIEVYVNGALVSQQEVPPGPFELTNIPVAAGAGNAQIVVRDVFGREQIAGQPYYYSTEVLAQGIREYVYSAGFLRQGFGSTSFDYGDPALLAFHRLGITDNLTAGGRFEASRSLISGGPTVSKRTRFGDIDITAAFSDDRGSTGEAGQLGYRYLARRFSFGGLVRAFTHNYANLSMRREADRPLHDSSVFVTFLASRANFTAQWSATDMRDTPNTDRVSLLTSVPLGPRTSLFLSVGSANEGLGRKPQVFAGFSFFLGPQTAASITVDHHDGRTQTVAEVQRSLPVGTGYGYRLQSTSGGGVEQSGSGILQYQSSFGRYEMSLDPFHTDIRPTVSAAGGVVYQAGALLPTRPVEESFALVRVPDVKNVRVYASNVLVGRTNENGDLLVPNLLSYYGNRLSIDDRDVPLNYDVRSVERTIAPPYRGGAFVEFPVRQIRTITGSVVVRSGQSETVPAFGQLTLTGNAEAYVSPIGRSGEFYFENIPAGTYGALVEYHDGTCQFRLQIPGGGDSVVKLGRSVCSREAGKS